MNDKVIVIGSGFGGSITAGKLAEAGFQVTVLERGPWRDTVPVRSMGINHVTPFPRGWRLFTRLFRTLGSQRWWAKRFSPNKLGLYEFFFGDKVNVLCSSSVGGGSHVYSGINIRPVVPGYWDGHDPAISTEQMEAHYRAVLERMGSATPMADHAIPNTSTARFRDSGVLEPSPPPPDPRLGFLFAEETGNPQKVTDENGIERHEVDFNNPDDGFLGSPKGGKTTVDFIYLAPALKHKLTVRDLAEVKAIMRDEGGNRPRFKVEFYDHHAKRAQTLGADHVIVAAGTLNTLRLLFHSRDVARGLTGMPMLGQRFGTNGDMMGYWDYNEAGSDLSLGLPTAGGYRVKGAENPPIIGGGGFPSVDHYPLPKRIRERIKRGTFIAGIGEDAMDGVVSYTNGQLKINYDPDNSPVFKRIDDTVDAIAEKTGTKIYRPKKPITVHPTGGARLGASIEEGVVDANGEVFDIPGLYVADATALPRAPGGPPSMTIAAWANHVAESFIKRHKGDA
jgi:cholesterol oxidase